MAWVRIDEHFYDHPRWATAPGDSIALWLACMAWCNRNESDTGYIPTIKTQGLVNVRNLRATLRDLVERGAIEVEEGGFIVHDYVSFQQNDKVRMIREKRRAAGKKGAEHRWRPDTKQDGNEDGKCHSKPMATSIPKTDTDTERDLHTQTTDIIPHSLPSSSSVDISLSIAARAVYEGNPDRCETGDERRYVAGILRHMQTERRADATQLIANGLHPVDVASKLVGSGVDARNAARALGLPVPGEPA